MKHMLLYRVVWGNIGHLLGLAMGNHISTNHRIKAFDILTVRLKDIDLVECSRKTLQDLSQDVIFNNCFPGSLGHIFQQ